MTGRLAHSPADVIRYLLIGLGVGSRPSSNNAWPIYIQKEPDLPDNCITIYVTDGRIKASLQNGVQVIHPGILVRVRSQRGYTGGYDKANEAAIQLDQSVLNTTVIIGDAEYLVHSVNRSSDVLPLGEEDSGSGRELFTVNAVVALHQVES